MHSLGTRKSKTEMKTGDLVSYFKNPPKTITDCGIFEKKLGLLIKIDNVKKEALVMTQGDVITVSLDWITKDNEAFWGTCDDAN